MDPCWIPISIHWMCTRFHTIPHHITPYHTLPYSAEQIHLQCNTRATIRIRSHRNESKTVELYTQTPYRIVYSRNFVCDFISFCDSSRFVFVIIFRNHNEIDSNDDEKESLHLYVYMPRYAISYVKAIYVYIYQWCCVWHSFAASSFV